MKKPADRTERIIRRVLAEQEDLPGDARRDVSRLWAQYLSPHRGRIYAAIALTLVLSLHPVAFAFVLRFTVDQVFRLETGFDASRLDDQFLLMWLATYLNVIIWVAHLATNWTGNWLALKTGTKLVYELRRDLHTKLQQLHLGFYERTPTGRIMSRVLDDVQVIQHWSTGQFIAMTGHVTRLAVGAAVLFNFSWKAAILVFLSLPAYALALYRLQPAVRRANIVARRLGANMYGLAAERIAGIRVVKAFGRERSELRGLAHSAFEAFRVTMRIVLYQQSIGVFAALVTASITGLVICVAMAQVRNGDISLGTAMAFFILLAPVFQPVAALTSQITALESVFAVLRRVFSLLDEPVEVEQGSISLRGISGKIRFDHVTFTYPGQAEPALREIDLTIAPGERVAIMGPSGSGKTTLFSLLMRFYDPQEGEVRVGGVSLAEADHASVRRHVCLVQQEPTVFSGTILENIMYGRVDSDPELAIAAARQAELHEFIESLPKKYETEVGEGGVTLSGGQKQRLALATALLTRPEVLLLDDTTSSLDAHTEARIRETLCKALKGRTSLIITQRVATARDCDRIVILEKGRITRVGTHAELSVQDGFYRNISMQQNHCMADGDQG